MSNRITLAVITTLILLAVLTGVILYSRLPEQMASHWNASGEVDGYMPKFWGVFLMPIITAGMCIFFLVIPKIDPLKDNIATFRSYFNLFVVLLIVFMLYVYGLTIAWNLGCNRFSMESALLPAMGLLFIYVGAMLGKAKRNFFIGIRTPWTLSSDRVWDKTHQLGGKLFIAIGILTIVAAFFPEYFLWFIFIPLIIAMLFVVGYSYVLYHLETKA